MKLLRCWNRQKIEAMLLFSAAFLLLVAAPAGAHRVNVFAWVEGETVHTESSFPGGKEVNHGKIVVYDDKTGEKLLEAETDDQGKLSFPVPRRTDLRIELTAGMGHKNEWIVRAEEIEAADGGAATLPESGKPPETKALERERAAAPPGSTSPADAAQIEKTVEKVLDRRLAPMVKMMAELRQRRTSVADVVGGIGYIIGLAGLGAYIHYRRKIKELENR
jgi:nickel transport protein